MVSSDNENEEEIEQEGGEMEPTLELELESGEEPTKNRRHQHVFPPPPPLGRQSSIYSLTLDEFQHALSESGKNFGSMNMDEFLNSIWTAEEHAASSPAPPAAAAAGHHHSRLLIGEGSSSSANPGAPQFSLTKQGSIARQMSLPRQGSVTIPSPLFRKTVDEVWSEIQKTHQQRLQLVEVDSLVGHSSSTQKQPTYGEMTLEDFLVKAGVVREQCPPPSTQMGPAQVTIPAPLTWYQNNNTVPVPVPVPASTYVSKPTTSINIPTYPTLPHAGLGATPESSSTAYPGNGKSGGGGVGVYPVTPSNFNMGGLGIESPAPAPVPVPLPVSPVSSDGMCGNQGEGSNGGGIRGGRKRTIDGPVEKVVERRQRRMIKNRESAARSRARKQAYTVELEAELNQLKEENSHLKQALVGLKNMAELERKRKQQDIEEMKARAQQKKAMTTIEKLRQMQRSMSGPL